MGLDCFITIPPGSSNGAPKREMSDVVSRFIRDSEHYYKHVLSHIKECGVCDPAEALRGYLKNRENKMSFGRTSGMLVDLSNKYRKAFPDRVDASFPMTFLDRSLASGWQGYMKHVSRNPEIGMQDVNRAIAFEEEAWRREILASLPGLKKAARAVMDGGKKDPRGSPQPFFNLNFQLLRSKDHRGRDHGNAEVYDQAFKAVTAFAKKNYEMDPDPEVRKAVKLVRILRGDPKDGRILALPSRKEDDERTKLVNSRYMDDPDPDVSSLAQAFIVFSVMEG